MAKAKPSLKLVEMESRLGYRVDSLTYPVESLNRFYSDLRPVPRSIYQRTKDEFEEYERKRHRKDYDTIAEKVLPDLGVVKTITCGEDTVSLVCRNHVSFYNFTVDVHYGFGFDLPLLFTGDEAFRVVSVAKLQHFTSCSAIPTFFNLPREIRDKIYRFAIPKGKWKIEDTNDDDEFDLLSRCIGDPSGFYFPLSKELTVLGVDRRMREEALPLAYRRTHFYLADIDNLIKLLIAVGKIGRTNIESLEFTWESPADTNWGRVISPDCRNIFPTLPALHTARCVQLLKQCKKLELLRLYFESDLIINIPPDSYKADPGIRDLCSIRGIKRVEILDLTYESLEQGGFAKWLKGEMESPKETRQDEEGIGKYDCNQ